MTGELADLRKWATIFIAERTAKLIKKALRKTRCALATVSTTKNENFAEIVLYFKNDNFLRRT